MTDFVIFFDVPTLACHECVQRKRVLPDQEVTAPFKATSNLRVAFTKAFAAIFPAAAMLGRANIDFITLAGVSETPNADVFTPARAVYMQSVHIPYIVPTLEVRNVAPLETCISCYCVCNVYE